MSKKFSLNKSDFLKGLLMAVLVSAITVIQESLNSGTLLINWKSVLIASLSGGLAYLLKNFFTSDNSSREVGYTQEQLDTVVECEIMLDNVGLELIGTRPKDR